MNFLLNCFLNFFRKVDWKNLFPVLNLTLCGGFALVTWFLPVGDPNMSRLFSLVAAMVGFLALGQILRSREAEDAKTILEEVRLAGERLLSLEGDAELAKSPKMGASEYALVWGGFTGKYCAYNPAYEIERSDTGNLANDEGRAKLIDEVFIPRYMKKESSALYLFFTHDGEENLQYFKGLMKDLAERCKSTNRVIPDLQTKIKVRKLSTKRGADHSEMYIGYQHGKPTVIYELREPRAAHGKPTYYGILHNHTFFDVCGRGFEDDWSEAGVNGDVNIWAS